MTRPLIVRDLYDLDPEEAAQHNAMLRSAGDPFYAFNGYHDGVFGLTDPNNGDLNTARLMRKLRESGYWNIASLAGTAWLHDNPRIRGTGTRRTIEEAAEAIRSMGLDVTVKPDGMAYVTLGGYFEKGKRAAKQGKRKPADGRLAHGKPAHDKPVEWKAPERRTRRTKR